MIGVQEERIVEKKIDWSKAPEGATHFCLRGPEHTAWRDMSGVQSKYYMDGSWNDHGVTTEFCLRTAAAFEARPLTWNGEGLPPVGTVCEAIDLVFPAVGGGGASIFGGGGGSAGEVWIPCTVIAHTLVYGKESAVVNSERKVGWSPLPNQFRPIRTPEQIAAEERSSAICEMSSIIGSH